MKSKDTVYFVTAKCINGLRLYWDGHAFIPYGLGCVKVYKTKHMAIMVMKGRAKLFSGSLENFTVEQVQVFPDDIV